ncbi:MAG: type secretion target repeat protein domain protein [Rubrobacteraceae bacterium]|nr:type secretion target repeat protein domain protein [Rubrobacteraceae bacterium]
MSRNVSILGVVVVMTVTVLATVAVAFAVPGEGSNGQAKVPICHKGHVISVASPAWPAHAKHGDTKLVNDATELENGATELENPEGPCQPAGALPEEPSEGETPTLTTDASDATLPDGTISDVATLDVPEGTTGTIEFKLYGPFAADAVIGEDDCVDPDPEDPNAEHNFLFSDTEDVPDDEDSAGSGQYTSDPYTPTELGKYQWVATFTPDSGQDVDSPDELGCGEATEQSVVDGEAPSTIATEQNVTLAGEIGEDANPADPATDTSNIEGINQNDNTTLGTDNEDDDLYGDSLANKLLGGHGNDYLEGGQGPDRMVGGNQGDYVNGADGIPANDVINGGIGTDYCVGDVGDKFKNCDGNVAKVPVPSESAAFAEAGN